MSFPVGPNPNQPNYTQYPRPAPPRLASSPSTSPPLISREHTPILSSRVLTTQENARLFTILRTNLFFRSQQLNVGALIYKIYQEFSDYLNPAKFVGSVNSHVVFGTPYRDIDLTLDLKNEHDFHTLVPRIKNHLAGYGIEFKITQNYHEFKDQDNIWALFNLVDFEGKEVDIKISGHMAQPYLCTANEFHIVLSSQGEIAQICSTLTDVQTCLDHFSNKLFYPFDNAGMTDEQYYLKLNSYFSKSRKALFSFMHLVRKGFHSPLNRVYEGFWRQWTSATSFMNAISKSLKNHISIEQTQERHNFLMLLAMGVSHYFNDVSVLGKITEEISDGKEDDPRNLAIAFKNFQTENHGLLFLRYLSLNCLLYPLLQFDVRNGEKAQISNFHGFGDHIRYHIKDFSGAETPFIVPYDPLHLFLSYLEEARKCKDNEVWNKLETVCGFPAHLDKVIPLMLHFFQRKATDEKPMHNEWMLWNGHLQKIYSEILMIDEPSLPGEEANPALTEEVNPLRSTQIVKSCLEEEILSSTSLVTLFTHLPYVLQVQSSYEEAYQWIDLTVENVTKKAEDKQEAKGFLEGLAKVSSTLELHKTRKNYLTESLPFAFEEFVNEVLKHRSDTGINCLTELVNTPHPNSLFPHHLQRTRIVEGLIAALLNKGHYQQSVEFLESAQQRAFVPFNLDLTALFSDHLEHFKKETLLIWANGLLKASTVPFHLFKTESENTRATLAKGIQKLVDLNQTEGYKLFNLCHERGVFQGNSEHLQACLKSILSKLENASFSNSQLLTNSKIITPLIKILHFRQTPPNKFIKGLLIYSLKNRNTNQSQLIQELLDSPVIVTIEQLVWELTHEIAEACLMSLRDPQGLTSFPCLRRLIAPIDQELADMLSNHSSRNPKRLALLQKLMRHLKDGVSTKLPDAVIDELDHLRNQTDSEAFMDVWWNICCFVKKNEITEARVNKLIEIANRENFPPLEIFKGCSLFIPSEQDIKLGLHIAKIFQNVPVDQIQDVPEIIGDLLYKTLMNHSETLESSEQSSLNQAVTLWRTKRGFSTKEPIETIRMKIEGKFSRAAMVAKDSWVESLLSTYADDECTEVCQIWIKQLLDVSETTLALKWLQRITVNMPAKPSAPLLNSCVDAYQRMMHEAFEKRDDALLKSVLSLINPNHILVPELKTGLSTILHNFTSELFENKNRGVIKKTIESLKLIARFLAPELIPSLDSIVTRQSGKKGQEVITDQGKLNAFAAFLPYLVLDQTFDSKITDGLINLLHSIPTSKITEKTSSAIKKYFNDFIKICRDKQALRLFLVYQNHKLVSDSTSRSCAADLLNQTVDLKRAEASQLLKAFDTCEDEKVIQRAVTPLLSRESLLPLTWGYIRKFDKCTASLDSDYYSRLLCSLGEEKIDRDEWLDLMQRVACQEILKKRPDLLQTHLTHAKRFFDAFELTEPLENDPFYGVILFMLSIVIEQTDNQLLLCQKLYKKLSLQPKGIELEGFITAIRKTAIFDSFVQSTPYFSRDCRLAAFKQSLKPGEELFPSLFEASLGSERDQIKEKSEETERVSLALILLEHLDSELESREVAPLKANLVSYLTAQVGLTPLSTPRALTAGSNLYKKSVVKSTESSLSFAKALRQSHCVTDPSRIDEGRSLVRVMTPEISDNLLESLIDTIMLIEGKQLEELAKILYPKLLAYICKHPDCARRLQPLISHLPPLSYTMREREKEQLIKTCLNALEKGKENLTLLNLIRPWIVNPSLKDYRTVEILHKWARLSPPEEISLLKDSVALIERVQCTSKERDSLNAHIDITILFLIEGMRELELGWQLLEAATLERKEGCEHLSLSYISLFKAVCSSPTNQPLVSKMLNAPFGKHIYTNFKVIVDDICFNLLINWEKQSASQQIDLLLDSISQSVKDEYLPMTLRLKSELKALKNIIETGSNEEIEELVDSILDLVYKQEKDHPFVTEVITQIIELTTERDDVVLCAYEALLVLENFEYSVEKKLALYKNFASRLNEGEPSLNKFEAAKITLEKELPAIVEASSVEESTRKLVGQTYLAFLNVISTHNQVDSWRCINGTLHKLTRNNQVFYDEPEHVRYLEQIGKRLPGLLSFPTVIETTCFPSLFSYTHRHRKLSENTKEIKSLVEAEETPSNGYLLPLVNLVTSSPNPMDNSNLADEVNQLLFNKLTQSFREEQSDLLAAKLICLSYVIFEQTKTLTTAQVEKIAESVKLSHKSLSKNLCMVKGLLHLLLKRDFIEKIKLSLSDQQDIFSTIFLERQAVLERAYLFPKGIEFLFLLLKAGKAVENTDADVYLDLAKQVFSRPRKSDELELRYRCIEELSDRVTLIPGLLTPLLQEVLLLILFKNQKSDNLLVELLHLIPSGYQFPDIAFKPPQLRHLTDLIFESLIHQQQLPQWGKDYLTQAEEKNKELLFTHLFKIITDDDELPVITAEDEVVAPLACIKMINWIDNYLKAEKYMEALEVWSACLQPLLKTAPNSSYAHMTVFTDLLTRIQINSEALASLHNSVLEVLSGDSPPDRKLEILNILLLKIKSTSKDEFIKYRDSLINAFSKVVVQSTEDEISKIKATTIKQLCLSFCDLTLSDNKLETWELILTLLEIFDNYLFHLLERSEQEIILNTLKTGLKILFLSFESGSSESDKQAYFSLFEIVYQYENPSSISTELLHGVCRSKEHLYTLFVMTVVYWMNQHLDDHLDSPEMKNLCKTLLTAIAKGPRKFDGKLWSETVITLLAINNSLGMPVKFTEKERSNVVACIDDYLAREDSGRTGHPKLLELAIQPNDKTCVALTIPQKMKLYWILDDSKKYFDQCMTVEKIRDTLSDISVLCQHLYIESIKNKSIKNEMLKLYTSLHETRMLLMRKYFVEATDQAEATVLAGQAFCLFIKGGVRDLKPPPQEFINWNKELILMSLERTKAETTQVDRVAVEAYVNAPSTPSLKNDEVLQLMIAMSKIIPIYLQSKLSSEFEKTRKSLIELLEVTVFGANDENAIKCKNAFKEMIEALLKTDRETRMVAYLAETFFHQNVLTKDEFTEFAMVLIQKLEKLPKTSKAISHLKDLIYT